ncbi:hypothetical protein CBW65_03620 [Tumebacillus avium]|uniref:Uncharacterized protein n=1 Tax=Tumebacillus avium TaxID=1903704 RepID=A0A1Y0IIB7_9BACL|nr:SDR family NAD(P)-dependent oxidoreductase [Tumebacillus avium]ARU60251.1 hypothetical protein CBW65_03620 [Tumebacillus avium]
MEKLLRLVIESTTQGQIDKQTAAKLLHLIKNEDWKVNEDIAIIGVSAQLPHVRDLDEFWENIKHNVDFTGPLPESRKRDIDRFLDYTGLEDLDSIRYLEGAFLDEIDKFDYGLFRLSPLEASLMDPYQRLFLQTAFSVIEDAGYGGKKAAKTSTGVYVGYASNAKDCYQKMVLDVSPELMAAAGVGNVNAMLPSRISYLLDLKGPSLVLDTACSSALVAVHTAVNAIQNGDCEMAIAGSVRMNLLPFEKDYLNFGFESSDGRTRTFDDLSDGAGMGEGILAVMLKPLSKAVKDRDNIYAVIKGTASNQDGTSIGITAPNPDSQMEVILKAWKEAGINPETLAYIESHGTGTTLGDPLELDGLERAYRRYSDKTGVTALGSVKTNLGHLFESAGLAGMLKCTMMLQNRQIPPNNYFHRPNKKFSFQESPVYVSNMLRSYDGADPMRCGLSSFGFSGTNVHMVLEEAPVSKRDAIVEGPQVFTLSARSIAALSTAVENYLHFLEQKGDTLHLADICYTASTGRGHYGYRLALTAHDVPELLTLLKGLQAAGLEQFADPRCSYGEHKIVPPTKEQRGEREITDREKLELSRKSKTALEEKDFSLVRSLYIQGADVPWETLYAELPVRKVSLPVYPFEKIRCWLNVPDGKKDLPVQQGPDQFFTMGWKPEPLQAEVRCGTSGPVLIFLDEKGIGAELADKYRAIGRKVITVALGSAYSRVSDNHFTITGGAGDYAKLIRDLQELPFDKVIHLFAIREGAEFNTLAELEQNQEHSVYSLFHLTRAMFRGGVERDLDIAVLAENAAEVSKTEGRLQPENATVFGIGKVVRKEHGNYRVRCLDLDGLTSVDTIFAELQAHIDLYQVAYRANVRFVEEFTEIDLNRTDDRPLEIREDGVYVITGGTGGIGLEVARWLAGQAKINLVLINRTPMPPQQEWDAILEAGTDSRNLKKIRDLREIEALGATVTCYSASVASYDEMQTVLADVRAKFGAIHGVVHGAGVGGGTMLVDRRLEDFYNVFSPKVQGTWNLDRLTRVDNLDFMVLFSSIASMFPAPQQAEYIAANGYQDSYGSYRNRLGLRTIVINWSTWRETGMSVHHDFTVDTLFKAIMTRDAIKGLERALNKNVPRALIGEIAFDSKMIFLLDRFNFHLSYKVRKELEKRTGGRKKVQRKSSEEITHVRIAGREEGSYSDLEVRVGTIWARVLGFEELNIYDNFYELGGDSITGLRIANLVNDDLGIEIGVADLLSFLTVADFVGYLNDTGLAALAGGNSLYNLLVPVDATPHYPASSAQKRLFVIHELEPFSVKYNLSKTINIKGPLDIDRLQLVFEKLVKRHETLRTSFRLENGEPVQYVMEQLPFSIELYEAAEADVDDVLSRFIRPFDLSNPPLFRVGVIKLAAETFMMSFDMHHIITDGVSMDVLIQDFVALYEGQQLPPLKLQYKDYATWQQHVLHEGLLQDQEAYWLDVFQGEVPVLNLPTDFPRPAQKSDEGDTISMTLEAEQLELISGLTKATGTTLYMLLVSAYNVLLSKYSAQEDIVIGTPILGRPHTDLEQIVGIFVNTLVLRNFPSADKTFKSFLHEVRDNTLKAYENQDYQLEEFVSKLRLTRDLSRNPLFDVWFVLQNVGTSEVQLSDVAISPYAYENTTAKFDLMLEVIEKDDALIINLNYCTKLYKQETAFRILRDYVEMLNSVCRDADVAISDIELYSARGFLGATDEEEELEEVEFNF